MKRKALKAAFIFMAITFIFTAITGCAGKKDENKTGQVIKVGYFPNITHAQVLVGISDGSFQKALGEGVAIEEHTFNAGPSEIEALLTGQIDIGYIGPTPAINGYVRSRGGLRIVAGACDAGAVLLARKDSGIASVGDLDGKKVAIPQIGNTQDLTLRYLLSEVNLKDSSKGGTVTIIPVENPDILTLIAKGEVDAAFVPEPWGSRIIKAAGAYVVLDANKVWGDGKYTSAIVIVSSKFLKEKPDLVQKWLAAHVDLTERINRDKEGSKTVVNGQIEKMTKKRLPEDVLNSSFARTFITYDPETESIEKFVKISLDNGYIKEEADINQLVNLEILNNVLKQKGLPTI